MGQPPLFSSVVVSQKHFFGFLQVFPAFFPFSFSFIIIVF